MYNFKEQINNNLLIFKNYISTHKNIVIISFILAIIMTALTPHWWMKSKYWKNKTPLQEPAGMEVYFDNTNSVTKHTNYKSDVHNIEFTSELDRDIFVYLIYKNNKKYLKNTLVFAPPPPRN